MRDPGNEVAYRAFTLLHTYNFRVKYFGFISGRADILEGLYAGGLMSWELISTIISLLANRGACISETYERGGWGGGL